MPQDCNYHMQRLPGRVLDQLQPRELLGAVVVIVLVLAEQLDLHVVLGVSLDWVSPSLRQGGSNVTKLHMSKGVGWEA